MILSPPALPATLPTPPAIIQYYGVANNLSLDILSPNTYKLDSNQKHISFIADKEMKSNVTNYNGFENIIRSFNNNKNEAISKYKQIYKTDYFNFEILESFLTAIETTVRYSRFIPRFSFYPDGARVLFIINKEEVTIEYDFDEPEAVFISKYIKEVLYIKNATINNISQTLGAFV